MFYVSNMIPYPSYLAFQILIQVVQSLPTKEQISTSTEDTNTLRTEIAPPWVPNPDFRGTSGILWNCIVTLSACVYTAIHLNVPPAREGKWRALWQRTKWVAMALLAPEIVLYCALTQFWDARELVKHLNKIQNDECSCLLPRDSKEALLPSRQSKDITEEVRTEWQIVDDGASSVSW